MSIEDNIQMVKDFFCAIGNGDRQRTLAMVAGDIDLWITGFSTSLSRMQS
jgi:uncharacterized protein